jgi:gas vesicle protein
MDSKFEAIVMTEKKYWLAFGIGVAAGAAVALLYAPQSGARTRKQLRRGMEDAGDYIENAGDYLKEQAERFSNEAHKAINRAKGQVEAVVEKASDVVSDTVKSAKSLV